MRVYKLSGKFGKVLYTVPLVAVLIALIGALYGYINFQNPIYPTQILVTAAFCAALVLIPGIAAHLAKCRSMRLVWWLGVFYFAVGLYTAWVTFEYTLVNRALPPGTRPLGWWELFLRPTQVYLFASKISNTGWTSIFGGRIDGYLLWALWGIETGLIFLCATDAPASLMKDTFVFCEACNDWCKEEKPLVFGVPDDDAELRSRLKAGDFNVLDELPPRPRKRNEPQLSVEVHRCENCAWTIGLKATLTNRATGKSGGEEKQEALTEMLLFTGDEVLELPEVLRCRDALAIEASEPKKDADES